jgi:hypothetical protein
MFLYVSELNLNAETSNISTHEVFKFLWFRWVPLVSISPSPNTSEHEVTFILELPVSQ